MSRQVAKDRKRKTQTTERLWKTPKTFEVILNHVRNGGSLISLCETWGVQYSDFINRIRADKALAAAYDQAIGDRSEWTDEMILNELRTRATFDVRRLYDAAGRRIPTHKLPIDIARMIDEIKADGSIKFMGKKEALEMAAKNRRLLVDRNEIEGSLKLEDILAASNQPPEGPAATPPA